MTARRFFLWSPVVVYMAAIFAASSMTSPPVPGGADKPWHALGYLGLTITVVRAIAGGLPRRIDVKLASIAVAIAVAYGISDEIHQAFVPGRSADVGDVLADAIGALLGAVACWAWGIISLTSRDEL